MEKREDVKRLFDMKHYGISSLKWKSIWDNLFAFNNDNKGLKIIGRE